MIRFKLKFVFIYLLFKISAFGVGLLPVHNIQGGLLGGVCLSHLGNSYAAFYNPAIVPFLDQHANMLGVYKPFQMPDMQNSYLEIFIPLGRTKLPVHFNMLIADKYRESHLAAGYGQKILENISIGVQMNGYFVSVSRYGSYTGAGLDLGFAARLHPRLQTGMVVSNLFTYEQAGVKMDLKPAMKMEVNYAPVNKSCISVQVNQNFSYGFGYGFSIFHHMNRYFTAHFGLQPVDDIWSGGFLLQMKKISVLYGLHLHPVLEETHLIGFNYLW